MSRKAGIAIDAWKLEIFERHLKQSGYVYKNEGSMAQDPKLLLLTVQTENLLALQATVEAANAEAAATGPKPTSMLTDGSPVTADHREIDPSTGQQKGYVVLTDEERAKGFVRPVRDKYVHTKCGALTQMGRSIAETYARDPSFYSGTFCVGCRTHLPLSEFVWDGTNEIVGS